MISPVTVFGEDAVKSPLTPEIIVNGVTFYTDAPEEVKGGLLYIPLTQSVAGVMGADLDTILDENNLMVARLLFKEYDLEFREGNGEMTLNGRREPMAGAPYASAVGALMVPAADLFRAMDSEVAWDEKNMTLRVTKRVKTTGILDRVPKEILEEKVPAAPEAAPEAMTGEQLEEYLSEGGKIQYTYEHSFGLEADTVSGDRDQSWLLPRQAFSNKFTVRTAGETRGGWDMEGILRVGSTTESGLKKSEIQRLNISLAKDGASIGLYDLLPRFSRFALRNYRLQGIDVKKTGGGWTFEGLAGKSPKKYRDSEYTRYVYGARVMRGTQQEHVAVNYVATRDTGGRRSTSQLENHFVGVSAQGIFSQNWTWSSEYAGSGTRNHSEDTSASGAAFQFQTRRITTVDLLEIGYETTGAGFVSETAYFTSGIREFSVMYNRRPNPDLQFGIGHKYRTLRGSRSYITPKLISLRPLDKYRNFKIDLRHDTEHTTGASFSLVDYRAVDVSHRIASVDLRAALGRRKTRTAAAPAALVSTYEFRVGVPVSKKTTATVQSNTEKRRASLSPVARTFRITLSHELGDWSDLSFSIERFYNGTDSDRYGASVAFRRLDIVNDREIILESSFMNYSSHNDTSVRMTYNFYK